MTGFDVTLIIGIIWLISCFICKKLFEQPRDVEEWLLFLMCSVLITVLLILVLGLIYMLGHALYTCDWHAYFHNKIITIK